jgi:plasmid stabilization system protein ParE
MDYQVRLSPSAQTDIEEIVGYISIDDPHRALVVGRTLIQHIKNLARFPEQGRIVPEIKDSDIREITSELIELFINWITTTNKFRWLGFGMLPEELRI